MGGWIGPVAAGLLAGGVSFLELMAARRQVPTWKAAHWIAIRLIFDASAGSLAFTVLVLAFDGLRWFTGPWPVLIAGLSGPALLRSQLALIGSGEEAAHYGPANAFRRLQEQVDRQIADICAVAETDWVWTVAIPRVSQLPPLEFKRRVVSYLRAPGVLNTDPEEQIGFVTRVLDDAGTPAEERCSTVVQRLLEVGGRRQVKQMILRSPTPKRHRAESPGSRAPVS